MGSKLQGGLKMKTGNKFNSVMCIVLCLILCLVSAVSTHAIATDGGNVSIDNLKVISDSGFTQAIDLYTPNGASADNQYPCVVVMHGGNNAKEQVNHWCVELSRRGYVVLNADMYGHGESEKLTNEEWLTAGRGLYDAVKYAATIPYVDSSRIGVLGYSRGGRALGECMALDNAAETQLMKALYIVHSDPVYKMDDAYTDVYGARDVGVCADKYDEFFFSEKAEVSGSTYNAEANRYALSSTTPVDYIVNASAQSFLYFGEDPATTGELRTAETVYEKEFDDGVGTRQINVTNETHMRPWFSSTVATLIMTFFDRTLPTNTTIAPSSHVFGLYFACSLLGLVSLMVFVLAVALTLIRRCKVFADVKFDDPVLITGVDKAGKIWFWLLQIICAAIGVFVLWMMNKLQLSTFWDVIFRSSIPTFHAIYCLLCGAYTILASVIWYFTYGKKHGFSLSGNGFSAAWKTIGKSFLVACISVACMLAVIFAADYLLQTNYMFVYWGFMAFDAERLLHMLIVLPFFTLFYCIMSFSVNCFNFNDVLGKKSWINSIVLAFFAALPTLFVIVYVYSVYRATNWNPNFGGMASAPTWVIALPALVFVFILMSRYLFKKTGNPYLAGLVTSLIATVAAWTVAEIRVPSVGASWAPSMKVSLLLLVGFGVSIVCFIYLRKEAKKQALEKV
jgi:dienelactone hydrolase